MLVLLLLSSALQPGYCLFPVVKEFGVFLIVGLYDGAVMGCRSVNQNGIGIKVFKFSKERHGFVGVGIGVDPVAENCIGGLVLILQLIDHH